MTTFSDDFNRADGAPGANWVLVSGLWVIVSNQLSPGTSGATVVIRAATSMATNDNAAQITIAATTPVSQGVFCRGDATLANGYLLRNDGTSWAIFKVVSGTFTSIGTFAAAAVAGDVAKIQAVGSLITGTINGVVRISLTDTAVTTGTSVGLRSMSTSGLRYDSFVSGDVGGAVTGDAALASTATLTATGQKTTVGDAAQAFTAGLTSSGTLSVTGNATLAAAATLAAVGVRTVQADAALAATAALTAAGQTATVGDTVLAATAALTAAGQRGVTTGASLAATAGLVAQGQVGSAGAAALAATATLTADGTATAQPSSAVLNAVAILTAAGSTTSVGSADLAATATLTARGAVISASSDVDFSIVAVAGRWTARTGPARWTAQPRLGQWVASPRQ